MMANSLYRSSALGSSPQRMTPPSSSHQCASFCNDRPCDIVLLPQKAGLQPHKVAACMCYKIDHASVFIPPHARDVIAVPLTAIQVLSVCDESGQAHWLRGPS